MRAVLWNRRAALLYSLGGWTVLGALLHGSYGSSGSSDPGSAEKEEDPQANQGPRKEVFIRETALGQVKTTITYREVQPPITRLLRRVKSFFDSNDSPPSEN